MNKGISVLSFIVSILALILALSGVVLPEGGAGSAGAFYYAIGTTDETTNSGNWEDIPDMSIVFTIEENRTAHVLFTGVFYIYGTFANTQGTFQILRNGTTVCGMGVAIRALNSPYTMAHNVVGQHAEELEAGIWEYKVQWKSVTNYDIRNYVASSPTAYHRALTVEVF